MRSKKKHNRTRFRDKEPRVNRRIRAPQVRVIAPEEAPQVLSVDKALEKAMKLGLDLVEISPNQKPPVCRIIDYGKFKFEQKKRSREQAKLQKSFTIKEIKLRPKIAENDYQLKFRNAQGFLKSGDKVKFSLRFSGQRNCASGIRNGCHAENACSLKRRSICRSKCQARRKTNQYGSSATR